MDMRLGIEHLMLLINIWNKEYGKIWKLILQNLLVVLMGDFIYLIIIILNNYLIIIEFMVI